MVLNIFPTKRNTNPGKKGCRNCGEPTNKGAYCCQECKDEHSPKCAIDGCKNIIDKGSIFCPDHKKAIEKQNLDILTKKGVIMRGNRD